MFHFGWEDLVRLAPAGPNRATLLGMLLEVMCLMVWLPWMSSHSREWVTVSAVLAHREKDTCTFTLSLSLLPGLRSPALAGGAGVGGGYQVTQVVGFSWVAGPGPAPPAHCVRPLHRARRRNLMGPVRWGGEAVEGEGGGRQQWVLCGRFGAVSWSTPRCVELHPRQMASIDSGT